FFFLLPPVHLPDLLSFPTRRSSDLRSVFVMIRYRDRNRDLIAHIRERLGTLGYNGIVASDHNITDDLYNPIACLLCCSKGLAVLDRKSTRLNSSHGSISYAVFCLKK